MPGWISVKCCYNFSVFNYQAYKLSGHWNSKLTVFSHNSCVILHILSPPPNTQTWSIFCFFEPASCSCLISALISCSPPHLPPFSVCGASATLLLSVSLFAPKYIIYVPDVCVFDFSFFFFKVWLDKTSTFPEICKWDIRSIRPWRSFNTDYFCIRWKPFWVPREPAVFSPLWQRLPSVHAQLPLLREGPGSAAETGQGHTGKCICGCRWRFWVLKLWRAAAANVVVFQLNISSLSLDLGNVIVLYKHKTGVQRDDSQQFQWYYQHEVPRFVVMG